MGGGVQCKRRLVGGVGGVRVRGGHGRHQLLLVDEDLQAGSMRALCGLTGKREVFIFSDVGNTRGGLCFR